MPEEDLDMGDGHADDDDADDGPVFKVDEILGTKVKKNVRYYKVRWTDTWELEQNLTECQEAIDAFWKRSGGKDKEKTGTVVNQEDSRSGKAYPLRNTNEEQTARSKKKRKGTSKKLSRQKRRKTQDNQSSSEGENGEEGEAADNAGGNSSTLSAPQPGAKKVKRTKSKKARNTNNKELLGSDETDATDDGDDGDDEDETVPLKQLITPVVPVEAAPSSTDHVASADVGNVAPPESETTGIPDNSIVEADDAVASVSIVTTEEISTSLSSVNTALSTTTSTCTTTTTTNCLVDDQSYDRLKGQRLGRGKKSESLTCASESEEEQTCQLLPPKPESESIPKPGVQVKEEPVSDRESATEEDYFKRTAKIKASFVIRRYCETGGDNENELQKSDSEEYVDAAEDFSEEVEHTSKAWVPTIARTFPHNTSEPDKEFPLEPNAISDPLEFRPSMVSPSFTGSSQEIIYISPNKDAYIHAAAYDPVVETGRDAENLPGPEILIDVSNDAADKQPTAVDLAPDNSANASSPLFNVLQNVPGNKVKSKVARVVFLVRKLIDGLNLKPSQVHEYVEALIAKAVIFTIRESYVGGKPDGMMLEKQINDLTEIVLNDIPYERLMTLLYGSSFTKTELAASQSMTPFSALSSALSVPIAQPIVTKNKTLPRSTVRNIPSNSPALLVHSVPRLNDVAIHPQISIVPPNHATVIAAPYLPYGAASPITFGQHARMESMGAATSPVVISSPPLTESGNQSTTIDTIIHI